MQSHDLIAALAATSKSSEKKTLIEAAYQAGNREFFVGAKLAYGAQISFGVKKVGEIEGEDDGTGDLSFDEFLVLADRLRTRALTGHAARDAIHDAADRCNIAVWNGFYRRILLRDFKVGCTESTINSVLNGIGGDALDYLIPVYSCQLAPSEALTYEEAAAVRGVKFVDVKYDGARLNAHLDKEAGTVNLYSREGQPIENFPQIVDALTKVMDLLPGSAMIDGEITAKDFSSLMGEFGSKKVSTGGVSFAAFDILPLDHFRAGESPRTQRERHAVLANLEASGALATVTDGLVSVHPKLEIDLDTEEGQQAFAEFMAEVQTMAISDPKVEGVMIKDPEAPYRCKRWKAWQKVKPQVDASLEVVELLPGKPGTKNANRVGALLCRGVDGDKEIEVQVGSGYTDDERDAWWANPELVLGMIAEVTADSFSQTKADKGTNRYSMRFPRLKGWRGTRPGEKI